MGNIISLEELLALPSVEDRAEVVEIEGLGTFKLRPLSLAEAEKMRLDCWQKDVFDGDRWQTLLLVNCIVEPNLTYDQAARVRQQPKGYMDGLIRAIDRLSGVTATGAISQAAVDEAEASFRDEPDESGDVSAG